MLNENREEIKVGDTVLLCHRDYQIPVQVTRITPTGRMLVTNHSNYFDKNGNEITSNRWSRFWLEPLTKEKEEELRKERIIRKALSAMRDMCNKQSLTYEQAVRVLLALEIAKEPVKAEKADNKEDMER